MAASKTKNLKIIADAFLKYQNGLDELRENFRKLINRFGKGERLHLIEERSKEIGIFSGLPLGILNNAEIRQSSKLIVSLINSVEEFDKQEPLTMEEKLYEIHYSQIQRALDSFLNYLNPFKATLDLQRQIYEINATFDDKSDLIEKLKNHKEGYKNLESALKKQHSNINELLSTKAISEFGEIYGKYITRYKLGACKWLVSAIVFAVLALVFCGMIVSDTWGWGIEESNNTNLHILFKNLILRLIVFSILTWGLKFSLKNYNINIHLMETYIYKSNLIEIYNKYNSFSIDDSIKATILLATSNALFSPIQTGALGKDHVDMDNVAIDLINKVVDKE